MLPSCNASKRGHRDLAANARRILTAAVDGCQQIWGKSANRERNRPGDRQGLTFFWSRSLLNGELRKSGTAKDEIGCFRQFPIEDSGTVGNVQKCASGGEAGCETPSGNSMTWLDFLRQLYGREQCVVAFVVASCAGTSSVFGVSERPLSHAQLCHDRSTARCLGRLERLRTGQKCASPLAFGPASWA